MYNYTHDCLTLYMHSKHQQFSSVWIDLLHIRVYSTCVYSTVELLYCAHHGYPRNCPYFRSERGGRREREGEGFHSALM